MKSFAEIARFLESISLYLPDTEAKKAQSISDQLKAVQITILSSVHSGELETQNVISNIEFEYKWAHRDHDNEKSEIVENLCYLQSNEEQQNWLEDHMNPQ